MTVGNSEIDLSGYEVTFHRQPWFGTYTWTAKAPNGEVFSSTGFAVLGKRRAEEDALRAIEERAHSETVSGAELQARRGSVRRRP